MLRGEYGKSLLRRRGELVERSFAHCYGAMRRCHLCGHAAGVEEPLRQACLDPSLTLHVLDKSKAALHKPNLCIRDKCIVRSRTRLRRPTCTKSATCTPG
jgi:hypothetical protein